MSRRITLVRHGESLANLGQRWQGQGNSALSELGRAQARALGQRLASRAFTRVVASDLERAEHTARALERPYETSARFREFDIGAWEGLTREEVAAQFPEQLARLDAGEDVALGGGESYSSFCARVDDALHTLRDAMDVGEHALVVCHGGVIGAVISGVLGLRGVREVPIARVLNTAVSEVSYETDGTPTVHVYNDSLHLSGLSLFPHPTEMRDAIGLVAGLPDPSFGIFAAHYDYELGLGPGICTWSDEETPRFLDIAGAVRKRHAEHRVALSARGERVRGWVDELLGTRDKLALPRMGALCHVVVGERVALVDYGVSR
ncbi:MAG TPA: histidine phosphatase family protein [Polyangiales bacterium]